MSKTPITVVRPFERSHGLNTHERLVGRKTNRLSQCSRYGKLNMSHETLIRKEFTGSLMDPLFGIYKIRRLIKPKSCRIPINNFTHFLSTLSAHLTISPLWNNFMNQRRSAASRSHHFAPNRANLPGTHSINHQFPFSPLPLFQPYAIRPGKGADRQG